MGTKSTVRRPVGRPRLKPSTGVPAKQAILEAAAGLFTAHGFDGTSTRQIADAVGIRQPSLFYHFKKKEDILYSLIGEAAQPWQSYLPALQRVDAPAAVKLYKLMCFDFRFLLSEPYGVGQLMLLPELRSGQLGAEVAKIRDSVIGAYRNLIGAGMHEGDFCVADIEVATNSVFGMGEAIWSWHHKDDGRDLNKLAETIADLAMRALLARPHELASIRDEAEKVSVNV